MAVKMFDGKKAVQVDVTSVVISGTNEDGTITGTTQLVASHNVSIGDSLHNIKGRITKSLYVAMNAEDTPTSKITQDVIDNVITANWQALTDNELQKASFDGSFGVYLQAVGNNEDATIEIPTKTKGTKRTLTYEWAITKKNKAGATVVEGQPKTVEVSSELKMREKLTSDAAYSDYKDAQFVADMFDPDNVSFKRGINKTVLRVTLVSSVDNE